MRFALIFYITLFSLTQGLAQQPIPGIITEKTEAVEEIVSMSRSFDPNKALMYSAALPGLGQVYNKKYWKVPLVYGGFVFLGYQIDVFQTGFMRYKGDLFAEIDGNPNTINTSGFNEQQLRTIVDRFRRQRDLFILYTGLFYLLQIVDAHIDAHLKEFDVNPKLQVRIEPSFEQNPYFASTGIGIKIKF